MGEYVIVSGTVGRGADGNIVPGGVYEQAKQAIENIRVALEQAGASLRDVVRTRTYLAFREYSSTDLDAAFALGLED